MSSKKNPILKSNKIRVGITIGDPSGIGPLITKAAMDKLQGFADFTVIADKGVIGRVSCSRLIDLANINQNRFKRGIVRAEYGKASVEYLDKALELLKDKDIDCLVTAPISKEAISLAGFKYSGHTEYFMEKTGSRRVVMMLLNERLRFSLVTRHVPLKDVSSKLSLSALCNNIKITHKALRSFFSISSPRIVVCGLNPHASDNGTIGTEENKKIKPALNRMKKFEGIDVTGPLSSDIAVSEACKRKYDCVIAMYHDQALIPLKLTGFDSGVNISLGLPFIRTSPLHGTAFGIANTPKLANPNSLISAIKLAVKCASHLKKA